MRAWIVRRVHHPAACDSSSRRSPPPDRTGGGPGAAVSLDYRDQAVIRGQTWRRRDRDLVRRRTARAMSSASARGQQCRRRHTRHRHFLPADAARRRRSARRSTACSASPLRSPLTASSRCPTASATRRQPACRAPASPPGTRSSPPAGRSAWRYGAGAGHGRRIDAVAATRARHRRPVVVTSSSDASWREPWRSARPTPSTHPRAGVGRGGPAGDRRPRRRLRRRDWRRRTLARSFRALARGGRWCPSASSADRRATRRLSADDEGRSLHGVFVGDRAMLERCCGRSPSTVSACHRSGVRLRPGPRRVRVSLVPRVRRQGRDPLTVGAEPAPASPAKRDRDIVLVVTLVGLAVTAFAHTLPGRFLLDMMAGDRALWHVEGRTATIYLTFDDGRNRRPRRSARRAG